MAYEIKTKANKGSVAAFLNGIEDPQKRKDAKTLNTLFKEVTGEKPKMWGDSIVGYGSFEYSNKSGFTGDWMLTGFSPRKSNFSLYVMTGLETKENKALLKKLGPYTTGKSCLYIKKLEEVDLTILKKLLKTSYTRAKAGERGC